MLLFRVWFFLNVSGLQLRQVVPVNNLSIRAKPDGSPSFPAESPRLLSFLPHLTTASALIGTTAPQSSSCPLPSDQIVFIM